MKHYRTVGIHNVESDVWDFYSLKEMYEHKTSCDNWKHCLRDAKKYLGHRWHGDEVRYFFNGQPVYKNIYNIVGFEDNNAWSDYYWILRPLGATDDSQDKFELWNSNDFYNNVIFIKRNNAKKNKGNNKKKPSKNHSLGGKRQISNN